jgi:hypothetical protein
VTLARRAANLIGMRVTILAMLAAGCGTNATAPSTDSGAPDAPIVFCSEMCGTVDAGADGAFPCDPGQICGQTGGVSGFICCTQSDSSICSPGFPGPGDCQ